MHLQPGRKLSEQKKLPENTRRVLRESSTETWWYTIIISIFGVIMLWWGLFVR